MRYPEAKQTDSPNSNAIRDTRSRIHNLVGGVVVFSRGSAKIGTCQVNRPSVPVVSRHVHFD